MPAWPNKVYGDLLVPAEMPQQFVKQAERAIMMQNALGEEEFNKTIQGIFAEWINRGDDAQAIGDKSASWATLAPKNGLSEEVDSEVFKEAKATMNAMTKETEGYSKLLKDEVQESALILAIINITMSSDESGSCETIKSAANVGAARIQVEEMRKKILYLRELTEAKLTIFRYTARLVRTDDLSPEESQAAIEMMRVEVFERTRPLAGADKSTNYTTRTVPSFVLLARILVNPPSDFKNKIAGWVKRAKSTRTRGSGSGSGRRWENKKDGNKGRLNKNAAEFTPTTPSDKGVCWTCGNQGHSKRQCPEWQRRQKAAVARDKARSDGNTDDKNKRTQNPRFTRRSRSPSSGE